MKLSLFQTKEVWAMILQHVDRKVICLNIYFLNQFDMSEKNDVFKHLPTKSI